MKHCDISRTEGTKGYICTEGFFHIGISNMILYIILLYHLSYIFIFGISNTILFICFGTKWQGGRGRTDAERVYTTG